jgi:hypothetical protein
MHSLEAGSYLALPATNVAEEINFKIVQVKMTIFSKKKMTVLFTLPYQTWVTV